MSFPQFTLLPVELQIQIFDPAMLDATPSYFCDFRWAYGTESSNWAPAPGLICIRTKKMFYLDSSLAGGLVGRLNILRTCRLSRLMALKWWRRSAECGNVLDRSLYTEEAKTAARRLVLEVLSELIEDMESGDGA